MDTNYMVSVDGQRPDATLTARTTPLTSPTGIV